MQSILIFSKDLSKRFNINFVNLSNHVVLCEEYDFRFVGETWYEVLQANYLTCGKLFLVLRILSFVLSLFFSVEILHR